MKQNIRDNQKGDEWFSVHAAHTSLEVSAGEPRELEESDDAAHEGDRRSNSESRYVAFVEDSIPWPRPECYDHLIVQEIE